MIASFYEVMSEVSFRASFMLYFCDLMRRIRIMFVFIALWDDSKSLPFFFFLAILLSSWPAARPFYRQTQFLLNL
jgi:hypothetical protein